LAELIGLMAIPPMPRDNESSTIRFWSSMFLGLSTSTVTFNSLAASCAPFSARVQKSATPLVM
jgi:hypothetical protein